MDFRPTDVYKNLFEAAKYANGKRVIASYGGSSSSKTISNLQLLTHIANTHPEPQVITIVGESIPVLKRSVIRDWKTVVMSDSYTEGRLNRNELLYTFPGGSIFQFIPADQEERFYAMRHDYVMVDEAFNISKGIFDQIEIRTRKKIFLTWNPVAEFWGKKLEDRDDAVVLHSTYKDNPFVEDTIIQSLERRAQTDENFYRVFVLGEYGSYEGLVFKEGVNWAKCKKLPKDYKRRVIGLDFGFSQDPTSILDIRYSEGEIWIDEVDFRPNMLNDEIGAILKDQGPRDLEVIADSAEPKSIAEIRRLGVNIQPCIKGPDSINYGIRTMKGYKMNITERSLNTIKEFRSYSYGKTKDGSFTPKPVDNWNHSIDAARYGITHIKRKPTFGSYAVS